MAHYLVTGVAGFIGSMVAKRLLKEGHTVTGVDNLSTGFRDMVPKGVSFIEAGIHEKKTMIQLEFEKFDAILHIAGQSGGEMSYDDPVYDLQANTQSTLLLLDLARKVGCKKILYASTVSVYGEPTESINISEDSRPLPKSFYGVGKLASENYLRIYAQQFGLDAAALRLFNVYGPGQNLENFQQGMTSIYLSQALRYKHIHVKGSSERYRDLIYIDDVVNAFITLLNLPFNGYRCYNVSTGEKTLVGQIVKQLQYNLPFDISVEYSGSTPGDVFGYTGDPSKLESETDWSPQTKLNDGIKEMVKWAVNK